jgi:hypothetical protein
MPDEKHPIEEVVEALGFYANPESYHAISFLADPPCGAFMDDFSEDHGHPNYERPMPGNRARRALTALGAWEREQGEQGGQGGEEEDIESLGAPVSREEYQEKVKVLAVPVEGTEVHHPKGGLAEGTLFWLHTHGMAQFDRPELEMFNVPAAHIGDAAGRLNHWAYHSIVKQEIQSGENLREGETAFHPFYEVILSPHPFWEKDGRTCLRIQLGAVPFKCERCSHKVH